MRYVAIVSALLLVGSIGCERDTNKVDPSTNNSPASYGGGPDQKNGDRDNSASGSSTGGTMGSDESATKDGGTIGAPIGTTGSKDDKKTMNKGATNGFTTDQPKGKAAGNTGGASNQP
jgi:hypothetical protein